MVSQHVRRSGDGCDEAAAAAGATGADLVGRFLGLTAGREVGGWADRVSSSGLVLYSDSIVQITASAYRRLAD
jgi:hypothetical protein